MMHQSPRFLKDSWDSGVGQTGPLSRYTDGSALDISGDAENHDSNKVKEPKHSSSLKNTVPKKPRKVLID